MQPSYFHHGLLAPDAVAICRDRRPRVVARPQGVLRMKTWQLSTSDRWIREILGVESSFEFEIPRAGGLAGRRILENSSNRVIPDHCQIGPNKD